MSYKITINGKESTWPNKPKMDIDVEGVCAKPNVNSVDEAPMDGKLYARCNGKWIEITTVTSMETNN